MTATEFRQYVQDEIEEDTKIARSFWIIMSLFAGISTGQYIWFLI